MGRKKNIDKTQINELEDASKASLIEDVQVETTIDVKPAPEVKAKVKKDRAKIVRGKRYQKANSLVDKNKLYGIDEAIENCKKSSTSKFVGSLELHLNLGLDVKAEQRVRASATLPFGTGKEVKVMAFVASDKEKSALDAGADFVGTDKTIDEILDGKFPINFDKVVATPDFMPKLAKIAKILGPKGLMPSPKTGTVSPEPEKAILELKKGRLEIKNEVNAPIIHLGLGKLNFSTQDLKENFLEVMRVIKEAKPAKLSGDFLKSANLSPTMGPATKLDLSAYK